MYVYNISPKENELTSPDLLISPRFKKSNNDDNPMTPAPTVLLCSLMRKLKKHFNNIPMQAFILYFRNSPHFQEGLGEGFSREIDE